MKHRMYRPLNRTLLSCAMASCFLMSSSMALAQSTASTIQGRVSADSVPAPGATVTVTNKNTGYTRSGVTTADGGYSLGGLPPGTYSVQVTSGGKTNSQEIITRVGQTATLNLGVGGVAETGAAGADATTLDTVSVTATAAVETKTSEVATYITPREIAALPQASRNFLSFADTVPGMIFETAPNGATSLRSGSQNANGINVYIDGVGQKSYTTGGGISGQLQSKGNPFPQLAIGEYKVITSNYKAEYDQISSAAVVALTKSGTNEFHGSFFWDQYNTPEWTAPTPAEERAGKELPSGETQYGASFGGPIVKDKLFFFLTYEAKEFSLPRQVRLGTNDPLPPDVPLIAGLSDLLVGTTIPFHEDLYFGKLTWQLNDANLIELTAKVRDESEITDIGDGPNTEPYGKTNNNNSRRYDLRYQWSGQDWLNDAHLTYEDEQFNPRALTISNGYQVNLNRQLVPGDPTSTNDYVGTLLNIGGSQDYQDKGQKGFGFQDDLTFTGIQGHTMQMGVKFKSVKVNAFEQQPYNPQFQIDYVAQYRAGNTTLDTVQPYAVRFGAPLPGVGERDITSSNKQYGIYFQDDWEVNEHLTLNLGLRYDYERTPGFENYVTPAGVVAALRSWPNINNANVDYNINDYISTGNNRKAFNSGWQPRLGFSYDLAGDQRHVIFGGAGRSYDRNLFDYIALEQSKSTFPSYGFNFNTANHPCAVGVNNCYNYDPSFLNRENLYALAALNPNVGSEVNLINNDIKVPYSDQFSLGMRNTVGLFGTDWNTSVAVAYIKSYDGILFTLGNRYPDGNFHPPGVTFGGAPFGYPIPGYGSLIIANNGIETRNTQLLLQANKPYTNDSPWGVTLAYTYTDGKENRGNAADNDEHYSFDYPNLDGLRFVRSVGISKSRFVGTGIVGWMGFQFSTKLVYATPPGKDGLNCYNPTGCANGSFQTYFFNEGKFFQWDLSAQKNFDTGVGLQYWVRADVLNVTNARNWRSFDTFAGDQNGPNANFGSHNDDVTEPMRSFKLSMGFDF